MSLVFMASSPVGWTQTYKLPVFYGESPTVWGELFIHHVFNSNSFSWAFSTSNSQRTEYFPWYLKWRTTTKVSLGFRCPWITNSFRRYFLGSFSKACKKGYESILHFTNTPVTLNLNNGPFRYHFLGVHTIYEFVYSNPSPERQVSKPEKKRWNGEKSSKTGEKNTKKIKTKKWRKKGFLASTKIIEIKDEKRKYFKLKRKEK